MRCTGPGQLPAASVPPCLRGCRERCGPGRTATRPWRAALDLDPDLELQLDVDLELDRRAPPAPPPPHGPWSMRRLCGEKYSIAYDVLRSSITVQPDQHGVQQGRKGLVAAYF